MTLCHILFERRGWVNMINCIFFFLKRKRKQLTKSRIYHVQYVTQTYTQTHTYTHTHTHTHTHTDIHTHAHTYTHTHTHAHTYTHTYTYTHIHIHTHTHRHTQRHTHTHIHTHTHTHTRSYAWLHLWCSALFKRGISDAVVVKVWDWDIFVNEFELHSRNHIYFRTNILGKRMNQIIPPTSGLSITNNIILKESICHWITHERLYVIK